MKVERGVKREREEEVEEERKRSRLEEQEEGDTDSPPEDDTEDSYSDVEHSLQGAVASLASLPGNLFTQPPYTLTPLLCHLSQPSLNHQTFSTNCNPLQILPLLFPPSHYLPPFSYPSLPLHPFHPPGMASVSVGSCGGLPDFSLPGIQGDIPGLEDLMSSESKSPNYSGPPLTPTLQCSAPCSA